MFAFIEAVTWCMHFCGACIYNTEDNVEILNSYMYLLPAYMGQPCFVCK